MYVHPYVSTYVVCRYTRTYIHNLHVYLCMYIYTFVICQGGWRKKSRGFFKCTLLYFPHTTPMDENLRVADHRLVKEVVRVHLVVLDTIWSPRVLLCHIRFLACCITQLEEINL